MPRVSRASERQRAEDQRVRDRSRNQERQFSVRLASFEDKMRDLHVAICTLCDSQFRQINRADRCPKCSRAGRTLFTRENNMYFGEVPSELRGLSLTEQVSIARVHPVVSLFRIFGQQRGYSGHVTNFIQRVEQVASRLPPQLRDLNALVVLNKDTPDGVVQFRVRAARVRNALIWLKQNNIYYHDITIDDDALANLPDDGYIGDHLANIERDNEAPNHGENEPEPDFRNQSSQSTVSASERDSVEMEERLSSQSTASATEGMSIDTLSADEDDVRDNLLDREVVPNLPALDQAAAMNANLRREPHVRDIGAWPDLSQNPQNEFITEGLVCRAFPTLFPYGYGDLRAPRENRISERQYFQYLMRYKDGRFADDERFPYYAYNALARWDAINCGSIYHRLNSMEGLTGEDLLEIVNDPNHDLASSIMFYGSSLRGTKSYWRQRSADLSQMVRQLGVPTIFFTLSAADYHWPDLFRLLAPDVPLSDLSDHDRRELMHSHPAKVAWFFDIRAKLFIDDIICRLFSVKEYWFRYEWQHRGSPHVHGLLWLDGAPDCSDLDSLSEQEHGQIIRYFDELVHAHINRLFQVPTAQNPCRARYTDLTDEQKLVDLDKILSSVQRHTRCGSYCLRKVRNSNRRVCRFGFPIPLEESSTLRVENGYWKFFPKRNDTLLQRYNKFIAQSWRGNTDFSAITSKEAVLRYIAKYASKGEQPSESYSEILSRIIRQNPAETPAKTLIRKLLTSSVAERNMSAQEVMHLLMGWPLFHASRSFIVLSLKSDWQVLGQRQSLIGHYSTRRELDNITLFDFVKKYRFRGQQVIMRQKECIVRVVPFLRLTDDPENNELYYQHQYKLYIPWRGNFDDLKPDDITWEEFYLTDPRAFVPPDAHEQEFPHVPDEIEFEDPQDDPDNFVRDPAMAAARLAPAANLDVAPLGHRLIDEGENWLHFQDYNITIDEVRHYLRTFNLADRQERNFVADIAYGALSSEQREVVDMCSEQIHNSQCQIKRILVQGKAGSGKSAVIKIMCQMLAERQRNLGMTTPYYEVMAPTGAAATNIDGQTIHSILHIPASGEMRPLAGENLRHFQLRFRNLRFIIIDEYSMIGLRFMTKIHRRLCEARGSSEEPFGGYNIYFFGDIRQLPPVRDLPIYMSPSQFDNDALFGKDLISKIQKFVVLRISHRQSREEEDFRQTLDSLARGTITRMGWQLLNRRTLERNRQDVLNNFQNATRLFPTNQEVVCYNEEKLARTGTPVAVIPARHNNESARQGSSLVAQGLPSKLYLSVGCRVMLRRNICVPRGLVNGSVGTVRAIIYRDGESPPMYPPQVLLIQFDNFTGPYFRDNLFPVFPIDVSWKEGSIDCTRSQFPIILAYALTIHKSQGMTLDKVVIDIGKKELAPGITYVGLSRVRRLQDLILKEPCDLDRLTSIASMRYVIVREQFMAYLERQASRQ